MCSTQRRNRREQLDVEAQGKEHIGGKVSECVSINIIG